VFESGGIPYSASTHPEQRIATTSSRAWSASWLSAGFWGLHGKNKDPQVEAADRVQRPKRAAMIAGEKV
jgi:hypothetical protein